MRSFLGPLGLASLVLAGCPANAAAPDAASSPDAASTCASLAGTYTLGDGVGTACTWAAGDTVRVVQDGCSAYVELPGGLESTNGTVDPYGAFSCSFTPAGGSTVGLGVSRTTRGLQIEERDPSTSDIVVLCLYEAS